MVAKTTFSKEDFVVILQPYDLGEYQDASPISAGTVQSNFVVRTYQGTFVLKYYESRSIESVQFEAQAVDYIRARDFPCPSIFKNNQDEAVGIYQEKPFIIFEFIAGHSIDNPDERQRQQIIRTAARLANITNGYIPPLREYRWNYHPALCLQLAEERAQRLGIPTAYGKVKWFEQTLSELDLPDALPKGICHCDFDASNILFHDGDLVALIDFDDANYTYLTFDLVCLIDGWAWDHTKPFNPDAARQIARSYLRYRDLSDLEKHYLFDVHKLSILFDGIWFFTRGQVEDFYERQKIEYLDRMGREAYRDALFAD